MNSLPAQEKEVSHNLFYLWRTVIAMAHADGHACPDEQDYFETIFNALRTRKGLTPEQEAVLREDLRTPQEVMDMLRHINAPEFRGQVLYFARLLAHKDGNLHPNEEILLEKLHAAAMEGIDMPALREEVQKYVKKEMEIHDEIREGWDEFRKSRRDANPLFWALDSLLLKLGIDLLS